MSRFVLCLVLTLTATCQAQQTRSASMGPGPLTVVNCVGAANGRIPVFTQAAPPNITICNSGIYEATPYGTGPIGILNPNPIAALDVSGNINASQYYQIGGSTVLSIGSPNSGDLFLGIDGGYSNTSGGQNTFTGSYAGYANTTGNGNSLYGFDAGTTEGGTYGTGSYNSFYGFGAGLSSSGGNNSVFGAFAGGWEGNPNTGNNNTSIGFTAGWATTGSFNTSLGSYAGSGISTGSYNIFLGSSAGAYNTVGSYDIYIGNSGPQSGGESNTIRIGDPAVQSAAYMAGVYGSTSSSGILMYVNSNGQLGTQTSSSRFKEQIRDMADSTSALMKLRPVTFLYKPEYSDGERTLQYGLIAEEVAQVYPELVAYDIDGQPYAVRYQYLNTMLLNEVQKQYRRAEVQAKVITTQQQKIDDLEQRLNRLERLVGDRAQMVAGK